MKAQIFKFQLAGEHVRDRLIACMAAAVCIALIVAVCSALAIGKADLPIIVAPMGASAIMVFVIPSSPLAQPWRVVGGNVISALVGVAVFQAMGSTAIASGAAVGGALLVMSLLRCMHPPGGAAALTAVIGSAPIHAAGYAFALAPVAINSVALVVLATIFHRWSRHSYPHRLVDTVQPEHAVPQPLFEDRDLDRALEEFHETFDISREDLGLLFARAQANAVERRRGATIPAA